MCQFPQVRRNRPSAETWGHLLCVSPIWKLSVSHCHHYLYPSQPAKLDLIELLLQHKQSTLLCSLSKCLSFGWAKPFMYEKLCFLKVFSKNIACTVLFCEIKCANLRVSTGTTGCDFLCLVFLTVQLPLKDPPSSSSFSFLKQLSAF